MRRARPVLFAVWISTMLVATSAAFALSTVVMRTDHTDHVGRFQPIGHRAHARPKPSPPPSTREPVESNPTTSTGLEHPRANAPSTEPTEPVTEPHAASPPTTSTTRTSTTADDHGDDDRPSPDD
jgi:hypothetical protein